MEEVYKASGLDHAPHVDQLQCGVVVVGGRRCQETSAWLHATIFGVKLLCDSHAEEYRQAEAEAHRHGRHGHALIAEFALLELLPARETLLAAIEDARRDHNKTIDNWRSAADSWYREGEALRRRVFFLESELNAMRTALEEPPRLLDVIQQLVVGAFALMGEKIAAWRRV